MGIDFGFPLSSVDKARSRISASRWRQGVLGCIGFAFLVLGCAIPGKLYMIAPGISGQVRGVPIPKDGARMTLDVAHRDNPELFVHQKGGLYPNGHFSFGPTEFVVAGHEYSKVYRAVLQLQVGRKTEIIWRAQYSRRALTGPIVLDCDLTRVAQLGQPCWVRDPMQHPWLLAEGEQTFRRLCVRCHGVDGGGEIGVTESLRSPPPDLREIAARNGGRYDRSKVARWIEGRSLRAAHGTRSMPIWGERLSEKYKRYSNPDALIGATLDPLVAYLQSQQKAK